jgi:hypothetical protein
MPKNTAPAKYAGFTAKKPIAEILKMLLWITEKDWRPLGDSNPCYIRERDVS